MAISVTAAEGSEIAASDLRHARRVFARTFTQYHEESINLDDCPLQLNIVAGPEELEQAPPMHGGQWDYMFAVTLARKARPGLLDPELGDFKATAVLVDAFKGAVVAGPHSVSWSVDIQDPYAGYASGLRATSLAALGKLFAPEGEGARQLDEVIHRYEAMPQSADLEAEEDLVAAGQSMTITLYNITDSHGSAAKEWQRLMVKVEHGELENSVPRQGDYYVFEVAGGSIELKYKASEECANQTEKVTVMNTCDIDPRQLPVDVRDEIASVEFEIVCLKGRLEATLNPNYTVQYQQSYDIVEEHPATLPFRLETTDDPKEFKIVADEDLAEGTVKTKRVVVMQQGRLTMEVHTLRTRAIHLRVPEGDVNLKRDPQRALYFHIDLRVYDPEETSWSVRPIATGPTTTREALSDTDWWFAHQYWTPVKEEHTEDVGVYRYRVHLEKKTVEYLESIR
jgi:hypothetical protein